MSEANLEMSPEARATSIRRARQAEEDARREEINRIEEDFVNPDFVKIYDSAYRKSSLLKITFGATKIYARFASGDTVEITEEQLQELTS